jgi:phospholipase/carboxylesterase
MRTETLGGLKVRITGGTDREGGGQGPVVVLLHGFGAPGEDLVSLWRVIDAPTGTRFVFPEAPLAPRELGGGRAWWMIDLEDIQRSMAAGHSRDLSTQVPEGLAEARAAVVAMLDDVDRTLRPSGLVLGGFSQGAMVSCDVALRTDRPLAGLAMLSGTYLAKSEWDPLMGARSGLPAFLSHGAADAMLPFDQSDRLRDALSAAGLNVTWVPFRGGHEIPPPVVQGLGAFLRGALAG